MAREALRYIHTQNIDIAVVNISMPDINIQTFLELIRLDMNINIPIIVMSPLDNEQAVIDALEAGANDFVNYPFRPSELILRIHRLLQQ